MKASVQAVFGWTLVLLSSPLCEASHHHNHRRLHEEHLERKHTHLHERDLKLAPTSDIAKRGTTCAFPGDADPNLVAITPDSDNAGWAMSPDQACVADSYCPYACKPGYVMAQWEKGSTVSYPSSMNGGLYCDKNGELEKPFDDKPYCVKGTGTVKAVNKAGGDVSFCQTVYPGNEAMIIPTLVKDSVTIAVPDTSYWCETSAHYYVNPPGTGAEGCVWGESSKAIGNWSPYVAGAKTDATGNTFLTLSWNPEWQKISALNSQPVDYKLEVECDGDCVGTPCGIDPSKGKGDVQSSNAGTGDAGNNFCVVTVPKGSTASIIVKSLDGSSSGGSKDDDDEEEEEEEEEEPTTSSAAPSTTSQEPTTTSEEPTTSSTTSTTVESTTVVSTSTTYEETTTSSSSSSSTPTLSSTETTSTSTKRKKITAKPGIFQELQNSTSTMTSGSHSATLTTGSDSEATGDAANDSGDEDDFAIARKGDPAMAGLVVAFVVALYFF
ncbi:uncharacterized protein F5Z01DRAFT_167443 [Emericellopsis atlantica]|uniref:Uncharacterized protein n=1 Tax=Emericellopsis atlantica TaxID=2614577 RepID=A0A9P7ZJS9_9HYPO|nr:uncharacterized protein F5Z01DRAFT_167443 [Emericellopsis atlantica]KAG9253404.1 hypothetical protein F5Z01DRAFT_167443 [Emericellopsis atlantica]